MSTKLIVILFFAQSICFWGQNHPVNLDSIQHEIKEQKGFEKLKSFYNYTFELSYIDIHKSNKICLKIEDILNEFNFLFNKDSVNKLLCKTYLLHGQNYGDLYIYDTAKLYLNNSRKVFKKTNLSSLELGKIYHSLSNYYTQTGDFNTSINFLDSALVIFMELKNEHSIAVSNYSMATLYAYLGELDEALFYSKEALSYFSKSNNTENIKLAYSSMAKIFIEMRELDSALLYSEKMFNIESIDNRSVKDSTRYFYNLGIIYQHKKKMDSALFFYRAYLNLPNIEMSREYEGVLIEFSKLNGTIDEKTIQILKDISKNSDHFIFRYNASQLLLKHFICGTQLEETLIHFFVLNDSLNSDNSKYQLAELKANYEYQLKEANLSNQLMKTNLSVAILKKQKLQTAIFVIIALTVLLMIVFFLRIKNIRKKKELQLTQNKLESKQRELLSMLREDSRKDALLDKLNKKVAVLESKNEASLVVNNIVSEVNRQLKNQSNWDLFQNKFHLVYSGFFDKLANKHPNLTVNEKRLCALLKMNMTNQEIANTLHIENNSVRMAKTRLKKKLSIDNVSLENYLSKY